jgi:hypothetical protein
MILPFGTETAGILKGFFPGKTDRATASLK